MKMRTCGHLCHTSFYAYSSDQNFCRVLSLAKLGFQVAGEKLITAVTAAKTDFVAK
jgi:hypothetical protein